MSPVLATYLALLAGYLLIAVCALLLVWRLTRGLLSASLRLALRAFTLAFLLTPGAVACGGAAITPFPLVVVADIVGFISPNGCGPYTPWNVILFVPVLVLAALALFYLERRRRRADSL